MPTNDFIANKNLFETIGLKRDSELQLIVKIASLTFQTPIVMLSLLDDQKEYVKVSEGIEIEEIDIDDSFCVHAKEDPKEVLVIPDAREDERVKGSSLTNSSFGIRFYTGSPILNKEGEIIGNLCVADNKARKPEKNQIEILKLLSNKAFDYLKREYLIAEQQKLIDDHSFRLEKLTDNTPGAIFQLRRRSEDSRFVFDFISRGILKLYPGLDYEQLHEHPETLLSGSGVFYDKLKIVRSLEDSFNKLIAWQYEYMVRIRDTDYMHVVKANPEKRTNGDVVWYGVFLDVTGQMIYKKAIKQIVFDISHIIRKPLTNLLGIADLIDGDKKYSEDQLKKIMSMILSSVKELDEFTRELNTNYTIKKQQLDSK